MEGLSPPGRDPTVSVGIVGCAAQPPQPPRHCLQICLAGQPENLATHGCALLTAAAKNAADPANLPAARCPKGFAVAAQRAVISGEPATLLTVHGQLPGPPRSPGGFDVVAHVDSAARLVQRVDELVTENAGFANEVLKTYEQLNLIFDLTQQITQVTEAGTIEALLIERVARLLQVDRVSVLSSDGGQRIHVHARTGRPALLYATVCEPALQELAQLVRTSRQVQVCQVDGQHTIAGPLLRLDDRVDVVVAQRAGGDGVFQASDMMLVESVLAFGGQIISNTEMHERLRKMSLEVTRAMVAAIDKKDHYTSGHSERGGFLTGLTARELGVPISEQQYMEWAGLLHDVGKIGIPEEILCKPGKLTPGEYEVIKKHPQMGYEILQPIASLSVILDGVLYHHESPDGTGYPAGLKGDEIPLVARIIHVVDTFDALTSTRAYRRAFTIEQATDIINQEKGTRVDAVTVDAFFGAFRRYRQEEPHDFRARFGERMEREARHARD